MFQIRLYTFSETWVCNAKQLYVELDSFVVEIRINLVVLSNWLNENKTMMCYIKSFPVQNILKI